MKTYLTENGAYDIYVDFDMENGKNISDYAYFQHTPEIVAKIAGDDWAYCSATALAQCMALYYNDFSISPMDYMDDYNNGFNWGNDNDEHIQQGLGHLYGAAFTDETNNTSCVGSEISFIDRLSSQVQQNSQKIKK